MRLIDADALKDKITDYLCFNVICNLCPFSTNDGQCDVESFIEDAPTVDAVQGEKMSNQRVIEWVPVRERKPHLPGIYLVTAQVFTGDILSTAAHFTPNGFLLDGVIAWAEMPAVWIDEQEQLTLF